MEKAVIEAFNRICNVFYLNITTGKYSGTINILCTLLTIYLIIYSIVFIISLFNIFRKEKISGYKAFIPFLNLYYYCKIININFVWMFVPLINIIVLFFSPYNLAWEFGLNKPKCILSVLFPIVMIPYIAFSNIKIFHRIESTMFIKNEKEADTLDNKLKANPKFDELDTDISTIEPTKNNFVSNIDVKIDEIEKNAISDDYSDQLYLMDKDLKEKEIENSADQAQMLDEEIEEFTDIFESNDIREVGVENKVKEIEVNSNIKVVNNADYKEYQMVGPEVGTIAFGGATIDKRVEQNKTEAKVIELKCPTCGSSLVGSNGTCPGCGHDVHEYIYQQTGVLKYDGK